MQPVCIFQAGQPIHPKAAHGAPSGSRLCAAACMLEIRLGKKCTIDRPTLGRRRKSRLAGLHRYEHSLDNCLTCVHLTHNSGRNNFS